MSIPVKAIKEEVPVITQRKKVGRRSRELCRLCGGPQLVPRPYLYAYIDFRRKQQGILLQRILFGIRGEQDEASGQ